MRRIHAICRKIFFFFFSKEKLKCNTKGERKKLFFGGEDQSYRVVKQEDQSDESNLPSHIKRRRKKNKNKNEARYRFIELRFNASRSSGRLARMDAAWAYETH